MGRIAIGLSSEIDLYPLTTSHVDILNENSIEIVGGIDINSLQRKRFRQLTGKPTWSKIENVPPHLQFDTLIVLVSPLSQKNIIEYFVKNFIFSTLICEKPLGGSLDDCLEIKRLLFKTSINVYINYSRIHSSSYEILNQYWNKETAGYGMLTFSHDLIRNGSHFISLLVNLSGNPVQISLIDKSIFYNIWSIKFEKSDFLVIEDKMSNFQIGNLNFINSEITVELSNGSQFSIFQNQSPGNRNYASWTSRSNVIANGDLNEGMRNLYTKVLFNFHNQLQTQESLLNAELTWKVINNLLIV